MKRIKKLELKYSELNMEQVFREFSEDTHCFFLDSSMKSEGLGKYPLSARSRRRSSYSRKE